MDSKMRVARTLTKFLVLEGKQKQKYSCIKGFPFPRCWTRRCERERRVESFSFFWCWTCGHERVRVLDCSNCFERVERRNEMEPYLSFDVWTRGFEGGRELLESSSFFEKVKDEMRWILFIAWPAKCWSLSLSTCTILQHYVLNFHQLHVWVEFPPQQLMHHT